ncbi:MAG: mechanosensitive ion channel family protein [Myxococcota bacterium]
MNLDVFQEWLASPTGRIGLAVLICVLVVLALQFVRSLARRALQRLAERTDNPLDDQIQQIVNDTSNWFLVALGVFAGTRVLELSETVDLWVQRAVIVVVLWQIGRWISSFVIYLVDRLGTTRDEEPEVVDTQEARKRAPAVIRLLAQFVVWSIVVLVALDNLGVDVTALVAGLGVGGVAVALAVQNVLGDLFASLSIVLDRPFEVGHFVVVGSEVGTIERVGLKTTRVRALSGEQIVFSNSDLLNSRVRNYRHMVERRVVLRFVIDYTATSEQLEQVLTGVKERVAALEHVRLDRFHIDRPGDHGFELELVYYIDDPDYTLHMDLKQDLLLKTTALMGEVGVRYAVPVRRLLGESPQA